MDNINLVIFDMDGLLFDTERPAYEAMRRLAKNHEIDYSFEDFKKIIGISGENSRKMMVDIYGEVFGQVYDSYREEHHKILDEEGLIVKPGALELLDVLNEKGIKRCIASSSARVVIEKFLKMSNLEERFDFYISGLEVERGKPYPDIFLKACELAGKKPEEALVLEDSLNGLKAAVAAGIRCILVPDLIEPTDEMKKLAIRICKDLGEVADFIEEKEERS